MWPREQTEAGAPDENAGGSPVGSGLQGEGANGAETTRPRPAGSKFAYPSGSRPLEGYTIKRGVGIGGFGEVYFATSDAGKEVALKRIQRNLDIELRGVRQCLNLKHQNLVALFDIKYDEQEQAWVVMEYVPGASLKDVIEQHPQGMPIEDVHRWFRGLAAGTAYLHDHGIVHRDLKPGNIFEDDGCVKIGDYGLSKFISCSRRSGQTESVGTFHYMAPEIGKGNYGREIDIYALGIILYEMLTGNVPFDGESTQEIIMKHLTSDPDVSRMAQPYRYVIQRALLKDPQKRFSAVYEMVDALGLASPSDISAISRGIVRPMSQPSVETPPVAMASPLNELLFIGEDAEMVFGPVKISSVGHETPTTNHAAEPPPVQHLFSPLPSTPSAQPSPPASSPTFQPALAVSTGAVSVGAASATSPYWVALDLENEPVWKATRKAWAHVQDWWVSPSVSTWVRIVVILVVVSALSGLVYFVVPAIALLLVGYGIYLGIRMLVNYSQGRTVAKPSASARQSNYAPRHGKGIFTPSSGATTFEEIAIPPIVSSPPRRSEDASRPYAVPQKFPASAPPEELKRERRTMLLSSMVLSTVIAIGFSSAVVMILRQFFDLRLGNVHLDYTRLSDSDTIALIIWLSVVSIASIWLMHIISRFFETRKGSLILPRIAMGAAGAGVALGALALLRFLQFVDLPTNERSFVFNWDWSTEFSTITFFFALFTLFNWGKRIDPMRSSRFRLERTATMIVLGGLLGVGCHFPLHWAVGIVAILTMTLQIGAARYSKTRRHEVNSPFMVSA